MRYFLNILMITLIIMTFSSCRHKETYKLLDSAEQIAEISIVTISFGEENEVIQTELTKVSNVEIFLEDFYEVDCFTWYGEPLDIMGDDSSVNVVKITYKDGSYELINWKGQSEYQKEKDRLRFSAGYSMFDEEQFGNLMEKYLLEGENE